jgi:hypothetical protein
VRGTLCVEGNRRASRNGRGSFPTRNPKRYDSQLFHRCTRGRDEWHNTSCDCVGTAISCGLNLRTSNEFQTTQVLLALVACQFNTHTVDHTNGPERGAYRSRKSGMDASMVSDCMSSMQLPLSRHVRISLQPCVTWAPPMHTHCQLHVLTLPQSRKT